MTEHAFPQELPQSGPDQTFNFKVKDDDIVDNSSWFISKIFGKFTSIAHVFLEWMALLTPYCLTFAVACYLLGSSSVVLGKVRENMIVILYNLRMFISMIFKVLTSRRYWENICVILENLCWFCLQILEASKNFAHSCFKWITVLASLILLRVWEIIIFILENLRIIIATIFEVLTNIRYWEISCAILESLRFFTWQISDALINITHSFLEFICLPASCRSTVSRYLLMSIAVVVVRVWEIMVAILDNLRIFTAMMFEVLTNIRYWEISCTIAHSCFKWITVLASLILLRVWEIIIFILENLRIIIATIFEVLTNIRYWEISCAILESLRFFTWQISDALINITHSFLEFICLPASCRSTVSRYLLMSIAVVVVRVWEIMVAILDNLRIFTAMMFEVLTNIRYWEISCTISDNLRLFILKISDALTSITHRLLEYVLKSISVVVAKVWEIMMAMFILKISNALTSITHHFLEWINLLASYCVSVPRSVLKSILLVVARLCVITVPDALTRITRRFSEWIIGRVYDNYHRETNEGDHPREGKTLTARFY